MGGWTGGSAWARDRFGAPAADKPEPDEAADPGP